MQSEGWSPDQSLLLRDCLGRGLSFSESAREVNRRFGTSFSRSAAIGRAKRLGIRPPSRPEPAAKTGQPAVAIGLPLRSNPPGAPIQRRRLPPVRPPVALRSLPLQPRLLSFAELGPGDCRYPYGGDRAGESIRFCGHPQLPGTSYCGPHLHLTRNQQAGRFARRDVANVLRLVAAGALR